MLIGGSPLLHMLTQFRVAWVMGSYGGGKTLGSYLLAYELFKSGRYRYILGNSNSVWTDSPESVVLRDGKHVDAIMILDEGGLFMQFSRDANKFMLGLRKLNITILVPSVLPPSSRIKFLQIQRVLNANAVGLPLWIYQYRLSLGSEREKAYVSIWKPQEIYGIYDTVDYPVDDLYMSAWLEYWMETARASSPEWATWGAPPETFSDRRKRNLPDGKDPYLDQVGGEFEEVIESAETLSESLSLYAFEGSSKKNRNRR